MIRPLEWLLDLLYPRRCVFCDKLLADDQTDFCTVCRVSLRAQAPQPRSGTLFKRCVAPLCYEGAVRESLLRYKFRGCSHYAPAYGRLLAMKIKTELDGEYDLISWVPISRKRRRKRGYDQTELLARAAAKELGAPLVRTLHKIKNNPPQSGTSDVAMRRANVMGVYEAVLPERFAGKRVLLLDDIITTGSTLTESSRILLTAGAKSVVCAVLAIAQKNTSR